MRRQGWIKYLVTLACFLVFPLLAQVRTHVKDIEHAIEQKNFAAANTMLEEDVRYFLGQRNIDTLLHYIPLRGQVTEGLQGAEKASAAVFSFIDMLQEQKATPKQLMFACRQAADFFETSSRDKESYKASSLALQFAQILPDNEQEIARCEYNLGAYAHRLGDVSLSTDHHRRALQLRETDRSTPAEDLYFSYNGIGGMMWYASKYDSAGYYFQQALGALKKMPDNDLNKYYRPANIYNNLAAIYSAEGKTTEGINAMRQTIQNFQKFISSKDPHPKKASAAEGLYEAMDNLAGIYKEVGDYGQAGDLLNYSYTQKKTKLSQDNPAIFISEILLGQHYNSVRDYNKARQYLESGLAKLNKSGGDYLFWAGDAWYNLAMVHENTGDLKKAAACYDSAEVKYELSYQGAYDNMYMDFMRNASLFYAKINGYPKAYKKAQKVHSYLLSIDEGESLQGFYQLLHLAELNYIAQRYPEARRYSISALQTIDKKMGAGSTVMDSVKLEVFKPKAILIKAKSEYALRAEKDSVFLLGLSLQLDTALHILERRKVVIDDAESINIAMADNKELIDFAAKIALELSEVSYGALYQQKFINLLESGLYSRIRSRIERENAIRFSGVPPALLDEEKKIKEQIKSALGTADTGKAGVNGYLAAMTQWEKYLKKIRSQYPVYYNLRYETLFRSLPDLKKVIPPQVTLVRYYFIGSGLVAFVADKHQTHLVRLGNQDVNDQAIAFLEQNKGEEEQLKTLHELHNQIWAPIASLIKTKKVIIVPDGPLYNISFEMLPYRQISSYDQLRENGLIAKHTISYHYSLLMLGNDNTEQEKIDANYIAFAPGFSDELKHQYLEKVEDSAFIDRGYITLLPQPGTGALARKIQKLLGGDAYFDDASTLAAFRNKAGKHKIIHIATHASFNNLDPQRSGLIFAKASGADSNFLYLPDIYGCDMRSNLTLLTACESGRPGYQDGEGMVSLAHAFNYAGSRSIVTALWKVDEQSATGITGAFIDYVKNGLSLDEALRQAKLDYLKTAKGRLVHPAYWSGLILMGEPSVLHFRQHPNYLLVTLAVSLIAVLALVLLLRRKKAKV